MIRSSIICTLEQILLVLSRDGATIDGSWTDNRIYTPDYTLQFTVTHKLMSTVTSSLSLLGSGFQRRTFPFLWVPELSPVSAASF
jgi:hypothetical protein